MVMFCESVLTTAPPLAYHWIWRTKSGVTTSSFSSQAVQRKAAEGATAIRDEGDVNRLLAAEASVQDTCNDPAPLKRRRRRSEPFRNAPQRFVSRERYVDFGAPRMGTDRAYEGHRLAVLRDVVVALPCIPPLGCRRLASCSIRYGQLATFFARSATFSRSGSVCRFRATEINRRSSIRSQSNRRS